MKAFVHLLEDGIEKPSEAILNAVDRYMDGGCDRNELEKTVRMSVATSGLAGLSSAPGVRLLMDKVEA